MPAFLADYPPDRVAEITGLGRGRHPHRRGDDRRGGRLDDLLDHGSQPEHARHLEHQRHLQPAPGHRCDLPPRQRADVADRAAQRDGWPRDGLHGAGSAGAARGARPPRTGRSSKRSGSCEPGTIRTDVGPGTIDDVRADGGRRDQGLLDHLHQSRCHRGQPEYRHRRRCEPPNSSSPRTPIATPRPTATPTSCCPPRCGPSPTR